MNNQNNNLSDNEKLFKNTNPKNEVKTQISFNVLLLIGIIISFLFIFICIFMFRNYFFKNLTPQSNNTKSTTNFSSKINSINNSPQNDKSIINGLKLYESEKFNYSFQYPIDYRLEIGENGNQLLEKISLYNKQYQYPLFNLTVWNYSNGILQRQDVENWCFKTLLDEAHKENILCAFLSSAAIDEVEISNKITFSVNSYNSFGEKVAYYIIPLNNKVIFIQSITLLNEKLIDNGVSKSNEIIDTIKIN